MSLFAGIYVEYVAPNRPGLQWLPQVSLSSVTNLHHTASRTLLTQTFINPSTVSSIPSAKYTFPLYESCAVVAFRCYVGSRLIEGIIKEKEDASATFQAAVDRHQPASLLEQQTADVFTTSIGNIPAGETIKVEIEYIMELKHDAEVDGLRFTIPTSVAPRYGAPPIGLSPSNTTPVTGRTMNISVQISMSSSIMSVQSPSHPISLYLGRHSTDTSDDTFNPQHALATLGQTTTELGKDFILLVKCASLSSPTALLEVHPTIPNSKALMVTLVPKFNLPKSTKPEVVFIVDRSGSMSPRVAPLKSSLSVFLRSLPLDVNFNICSFGSHHSFLWDRSRPYSDQSFAEAQRHCDQMRADFGGTEILPAIQSTIERRLKDLNLEIMVLTDGEVWNSEALFKYVEKETEKGDVRLFSLGIGRNVSHALIDGLARVGRGFSQVVSDEREGMESKVARMLRGALSAHVINYRLEWEGKPSTRAVEQSSSPIARARRYISLFDSRANIESPVSFSDSPRFTIPSVIQAPYKIQPLFPFSRSTAYALLSSDVPPPSRVWLRGTTPEGDELELEIAVQSVPVQGETIHQLAARKILQELKDGTSYVHGALDKERQPALLAEWVKKEGVRVGLKYGVASHWTSFVAVEREAAEAERRDQGIVDEPPPSELDDDEDWDTVIDAGHDDDDDGNPGGSPVNAPSGSRIPGGGRGRGRGVSVPVMMMMAPPPPPIPYPTKRSSSKISPSSTYFGSLKGKSASKTGKSDSFESLGLKASPTYSDSESDSKVIGSARLSSSSSRRSPSPPTYGSSSPLPFIGSNPTGKGLERESDNKSTKMPFLLGSRQQQMNPPLFSAPSPFSFAPVSQQQSVSPGSAIAGSAPPPLSAPAVSGRKSRHSASTSLSPSGFTGAAPEAMFGAFSSLLSNPPSASDLGQGDSSTPLIQEGYKPFKPAAAKFFGGGKKSTAPDIGISYSPLSAPPPERLSADTGAQPLSSRSKNLINLQTFEGSFTLDSALATLLGVSISVLETKLTSFIPSVGLSSEKKRKVWATILTIKVFETRLAGDRSVWQLVVDKARVWMGSLDGLGVGDITQLEEMAGEVLGA